MSQQITKAQLQPTAFGIFFLPRKHSMVDGSDKSVKKKHRCLSHSKSPLTFKIEHVFDIGTDKRQTGACFFFIQNHLGTILVSTPLKASSNLMKVGFENQKKEFPSDRRLAFPDWFLVNNILLKIKDTASDFWKLPCRSLFFFGASQSISNHKFFESVDFPAWSTVLESNK